MDEEDFEDESDEKGRCPGCGEIDCMEKIPHHLGGGHIEMYWTCVYCGNVADED